MSDFHKTVVRVCTPMKRWNNPEEMRQSWCKFLQDLSDLTADPDCPYEFVWSMIDMGVVPARNKLVHNFRKSTDKWLVWLDYDMEPQEGESLAQLLIHLLSKKLPVIGGLYTTRAENAHYVCNFLFDAEPQKESVLQVIELGTGALKCYHREVFDQVEAKFPQIGYVDRDTGEKMCGFFQHVVVTHDMQATGDLLPEDYFMDFLCRMSKISVWVDTAVKLRHLDPDGTTYPHGDWPPIPGLTK